MVRIIELSLSYKIEANQKYTLIQTSRPTPPCLSLSYTDCKMLNLPSQLCNQAVDGDGLYKFEKKSRASIHLLIIMIKVVVEEHNNTL